MSLSAQHHQTIDLILEGKHEYGEVAKQIGIHRRTLERWRKRKDFSIELTKRRKTITAQVDERLAEIEQFALQSLLKAAASGPNSFSVRAARHLMDIAGKRLVRDAREVTPMSREERVEYLRDKVRSDELVEALELQGISVAH